MPLVNNINAIDVTNAMTARSKNLRRYRVGNDQDFIDYIETVESTTYEYPRATEQAAKNAIELIKNQTTAENQTVNASMVEDVRNVGSYKVIYTSTTTTTTQAAVAPAPEVGGITWSRNSETVSSWPQSITMTSANSAERIWYRIDAINNSGATVPGEFTDGGSNNVTVSLNADTLAAGYNGWHKRVIIIAEVRRTQLTGETYVGAQSSRRFTQNAPSVSSISWSISDNFTVTSWPVSITATTSTTNASVFHRITAFNNFGQGIVGSFTSGGSISADTSIFSAGANGFHKHIYVEAEARLTLDGFVYIGARSGRNVRQLVPSVGSLTFNPAGLTSSKPSPYHVTFPINLTISSSNSNAFIQAKLSKDEGWGWTSYPNYSNYVNIGQGSGTINNIDTNRRFGAYQIKEVRVQAYAYVNLDGYVYTGSVIARYYIDRL